MAFNRPTLPALIERIQQDIESRLLGPDSRLHRAVLGALSRSLAGNGTQPAWTPGPAKSADHS